MVGGRGQGRINRGKGQGRVNKGRDRGRGQTTGT